MKIQRGSVKKVDFRFEFTTKVKEYLDDEKDEKIIKDGHRDIIFQYLYPLESEIGIYKNPNFTFCIRKTLAYRIRKH